MRGTSQEEQKEAELQINEGHVMRAAVLVIATAVVTAMLYIGRSVLIPTALAIFLSYILAPMVSWMSEHEFGGKFRIPRSISTTFVVSLSLTLLVFLGVFIVNEVADLASELPEYEETMNDNFQAVREDITAWQRQFEESYLQPIRREDAPVEQQRDSQDEEIRVMLEQGSTELWTSISSYVFGSITSILAFTGQATMCLFVLFFILLEGPVLRTKTINLMGTSLRRRRIVLEIMHNVNEDVQRYLFNRVVTNIVLALLVGLIFYVYGLRYAFLIGVFAGIFNFVPYLGPAVGSIFPIAVAYMQFGDWKNVAWILFIYMFLTGMEGNVITPIVLGRHLKLNSLAVLLACIFWGWLWGPIGLFLAVPIMAVFKAMSEHIDGIRPMGELLRG